MGDLANVAVDKRGYSKWLLLLATIIFLIPVPSFALTFLGQWQVFQGPTGGPIFPNPAGVLSGDNIRGGFLEIDMRTFNAANEGSLTVTAVRDFRVNGASELVTIRRQFTSLLGDGRIRVTVNITPYNVNNPPPFNIPPVNFNRYGLPIGSVGDDSTSTGLFLGGNYRVTIQIVYEKTANGYWQNSSPHRFTFTGI